MSELLSVYLNDAPLGTITLDGHRDLYKLEYDQSWLQGSGYAISPHLQHGSCQSDQIKRFLANLLPEGKWLEELSIDNQISKNNIFGLIAVLGGETTGALTFRVNNLDQTVSQTRFRSVRPEELQARISRRQEVSIAMWDNKPRLSVAGVQDKLPLLIRDNGEMGFGDGDLASTHILKFGQHPDMHMVVNEYMCMELARLVKLPVAKAVLQRFGEPVLVVERFDRCLTGGWVERFHIIDGCQMLDLQPTYKYERPFGKSGEGAKIRTGASLPKLFAACRLCRIPALAIRDLLNWTLFQLIIGNNDAHGKNISFFVGKKGIDIAPGYDLLNIDIYGDKYDQDLAMAVGDSFRSDEIFAYQLAEMCDDCGLPQRQVALSLKNLCLDVLKSLDALAIDAVFTKEETIFANELKGMINKNTTRFLKMSNELPHVIL